MTCEQYFQLLNEVAKLLVVFFAGFLFAVLVRRSK